MYSFSTNGYSLHKNKEIINELSCDPYLSAVQVSMESPDREKMIF